MTKDKCYHNHTHKYETVREYAYYLLKVCIYCRGKKWFLRRNL